MFEPSRFAHSIMIIELGFGCPGLVELLILGWDTGESGWQIAAITAFSHARNPETSLNLLRNIRHGAVQLFGLAASGIRR
jgi:hypothetical protein